LYFTACGRYAFRFENGGIDKMAKKAKKPEFTPVSESDLDPSHRWHRPLQAPGVTQVDFEERVEFRRLHRYRVARTRQSLANSDLGAMLCFDQHNIRYISSTVIGEWARDKLIRYCLITGNGEPWVWDFGSAARHHRIYCPWLREDHVRAGNPGMRGAIGPDVGLFKQAAKEIKEILEKEGVAGMPLGLDVCEPPMLFALQEQGIEVRDGQQMMLAAREIKSHDEITLLNIAASMVDGVYQDIAAALKPGVKESQIVALAAKRLYEMGSDCVEAINSIAGERCSPHPHNFTDRLIRPGDQAYFDIIHSFIGYRTCYYRTFTVGSATQAQRDAYKKARQWMDDAIALMKPGLTTDKAAKALPKASDIGFENEMAAFGLNFCHGLGLALHERPLISRLNSFAEPYELKEGMVFAVETFCPAKDGFSAARIEEEVVLTPNGAKIITLYPAKELPVANPYRD
jgi:Xaa-Pro dipeptidase